MSKKGGEILKGILSEKVALYKDISKYIKGWYNFNGGNPGKDFEGAGGMHVAVGKCWCIVRILYVHTISLFCEVSNDSHWARHVVGVWEETDYPHLP